MCCGPRRHIHLRSSTFPSVNICYAKYRYILLDMLSKYLAKKKYLPRGSTQGPSLREAVSLTARPLVQVARHLGNY